MLQERSFQQQLGAQLVAVSHHFFTALDIYRIDGRRAGLSFSVLKGSAGWTPNNNVTASWDCMPS